MYIYIYTGWWIQPLLKMMEFVSWGYDIPNCFWKVYHKIPWFQSPPTWIFLYSLLPWIFLVSWRPFGHGMAVATYSTAAVGAIGLLSQLGQPPLSWTVPVDPWWSVGELYWGLVRLTWAKTYKKLWKDPENYHF